MTWHVSQQLWQLYGSGAASESSAAAIDAHVADCPECQAGARRYAAGNQAAVHPTDATWRGVQIGISHPRPSRPARWLRLLGLTDEDLVIVSSSDNLRLPWAVAIGGALASVIIAGGLGRFADVGYLLISPLIPVLAVVAAFDATDPLRDIGAATPFSKLRVGLVRTLAALVVALPALVVLALGVPAFHPLLWVWLLPSLGLTAGALLALQRWNAWRSAGITAAVWSAVVLGASAGGRLRQLESLAGQSLFALAAAAAACWYVISVGGWAGRRPRPGSGHAPDAGGRR